MKVYVDFEDLDVEDRPTYICNRYNLQVKSINSGTRYDNVKLVSLSDYTKQVRKEVCEGIYKKCEPLFRLVNNYDNGDVIERNELVDILDQIQGDRQ